MFGINGRKLSADFIAVPVEPSGAERAPAPRTIDRSLILAELDQLTRECKAAGRMDLADRVLDARLRIRPMAKVPVVPGRTS
jgi:hypothetical protein